MVTVSCVGGAEGPTTGTVLLMLGYGAGGGTWLDGGGWIQVEDDTTGLFVGGVYIEVLVGGLTQVVDDDNGVVEQVVDDSTVV
jgi:hypothetical protein